MKQKLFLAYSLLFCSFTIFAGDSRGDFKVLSDGRIIVRSGHDRADLNSAETKIIFPDQGNVEQNARVIALIEEVLLSGDRVPAARNELKNILPQISRRNGISIGGPTDQNGFVCPGWFVSHDIKSAAPGCNITSGDLVQTSVFGNQDGGCYTTSRDTAHTDSRSAERSGRSGFMQNMRNLATTAFRSMGDWGNSAEERPTQGVSQGVHINHDYHQTSSNGLSAATSGRNTNRTHPDISATDDIAGSNARMSGVLPATFTRCRYGSVKMSAPRFKFVGTNIIGQSQFKGMPGQSTLEITVTDGSRLGDITFVDGVWGKVYVDRNSSVGNVTNGERINRD